jgi:hypothetical protein
MKKKGKMKKKNKNKFNPVAKHLRTFNKAQVMTDRKKESKKNGKYLDNQE